LVVLRHLRRFRYLDPDGQGAKKYRHLDSLIGSSDLSNITPMSKTEILEELPKLTKTQRHEIRLKLVELDDEAWLDEDDPITADEKALLDARLAAYEKDPDAGSSWEEVEARIRAHLTPQRPS
jgi:putative addiction module component (TIGR02574 family)